MSTHSVEITIREAVWPGDQAAVEMLLRSYAAHLAADVHGAGAICLRDFEVELAQSAERWSLPCGVLLLACLEDAPVGCVGLKLRPEHSASACEMKRLWVTDAARGRGLGRLLVNAAVAWCCQHGLTTLLLDTVPEAMPEAVALYRSAGFVETARHNANDVPGLLFMEKPLRCE